MVKLQVDVSQRTYLVHGPSRRLLRTRFAQAHNMVHSSVGFAAEIGGEPRPERQVNIVTSAFVPVRAQVTGFPYDVSAHVPS